MPVFENQLSANHLTVNSTIQSHLDVLHRCWSPMFPEKNFSVYRKLAQDAVAVVMKRDGIWGEEHFERQWSAFAPHGAIKRTAFIGAAEPHLQTALQMIYPPPPVARSSYATLRGAGKVLFNHATLEAKLSANDKTKVAAIFDRGTSYKGHGPTTSLGAGVLHAHVGNGTGLGFSWTGANLTIYARGDKSDRAPRGTSGYDWVTS